MQSPSGVFRKRDDIEFGLQSSSAESAATPCISTMSLFYPFILDLCLFASSVFPHRCVTCLLLTRSVSPLPHPPQQHQSNPSPRIILHTLHTANKADHRRPTQLTQATLLLLRSPFRNLHLKRTLILVGVDLPHLLTSSSRGRLWVMVSSLQRNSSKVEGYL